jgi:hypothetical protein
MTAPRRDPVHHWCYMRASSAGHGALFCPSARHGQQAPLMGVVWGLGSTVPVHPALLATCAPRYGPLWPRVMLRRAHSLPRSRSVVLGPCCHARSGWRRRGPPMGACAPVRGWIHLPRSGETDLVPWGLGEVEPAPKGSGETEPTPKWSGETGPMPLGLGETEPMPLGSGEMEPMPLGSDEAIVTPLIVQVN